MSPPACARLAPLQWSDDDPKLRNGIAGQTQSRSRARQHPDVLGGLGRTGLVCVMWLCWDLEERDRVHLHVTPGLFITTLGCPARGGGGCGHRRRDPCPGLPSLAARHGMARPVLGTALGKVPWAPRCRWAIPLFIKVWRKENKVMGHLLIQFVEFEQIFLIFLPERLERSGNRQNVHFQVLKLNLLRNPYWFALLWKILKPPDLAWVLIFSSRGKTLAQRKDITRGSKHLPSPPALPSAASGAACPGGCRRTQPCDTRLLGQPCSCRRPEATVPPPWSPPCVGPLLSAASRSGDGQREVLSSSPWYPGTGRLGAVQSCAGEGQTGHQGAFLHWEGGQTLEQASGRGRRCPKPVRVSEASGQCPSQRASARGQLWSRQAVGLGDRCRLLPIKILCSVLLCPVPAAPFRSSSLLSRQPSAKGPSDAAPAVLHALQRAAGAATKEQRPQEQRLESRCLGSKQLQVLKVRANLSAVRLGTRHSGGDGESQHTSRGTARFPSMAHGITRLTLESQPPLRNEAKSVPSRPPASVALS